jgi:penicillin-insensitive murein endopeptidase
VRRVADEPGPCRRAARVSIAASRFEARVTAGSIHSGALRCGLVSLPAHPATFPSAHGCAVVLAWLAALAIFQDGTRARAQDLASDGEAIEADSQSIGHTEAGRLEHAFALESRDGLVALRTNRFGTRELVGLLERAADAMARESPGSVLAVGELSSEHGGLLPPHGSHQSGRDADVGYFALDAAGEPVPQAVLTTFDVRGEARRGEEVLRFDDARNWALFVALVDDLAAEVQHILVASHLRARLLAYGEASGASEDVRRRVELVTEPIRGSEAHDDHFHVRIYCAVGDRPACLDRPPLHPWYEGTPSPEAVEAARAADALRAAAQRRAQAEARLAERALELEAQQQTARERARAAALEREPGRQAARERARAARLSADERRTLAALRASEEALRRDDGLRVTSTPGEETGGVDAARWAEAERRRAARLRDQLRRVEADERRRAEAARRAAQRDARLARRAESLRLASERRAQLLLRRAEALAAAQARDAARATR